MASERVAKRSTKAKKSVAPYAFIEYVDEIYTAVVPTRMLKGTSLFIDGIAQITEGKAIYEVKILSLGTQKECKQDQEKYDEDDEDSQSNNGSEEDRENFMDDYSQIEMDGSKDTQDNTCSDQIEDKCKDSRDGKENVEPRQNKRKQKCKSDTAVKKQKQTGSKQTRRVPVQKVKTKSEGDKLKGDTVAKKRRTKKKEVEKPVLEVGPDTPKDVDITKVDKGKMASDETDRDAMSNETDRDAMSNETDRDAMSNETDRDAMSNETDRDAMSNETGTDAMSKEIVSDVNTQEIDIPVIEMYREDPFYMDFDDFLYNRYDDDMSAELHPSLPSSADVKDQKYEDLNKTVSSLQESIQVMSRGLVMVSSKLDSFGAMQQPPTHSELAHGSGVNVLPNCSPPPTSQGPGAQPLESNNSELAHGSGANLLPTPPPPTSRGPTGLLPESELTLIFMKSCSRRNMSVHLTRRLFTEQVRKTSNVSGRNKQQLDPRIIKYIKSTSFKYFPSQNTDISKEWADCIISIDESCRRLRNKPTKKQLQGLN
ncbi:protein starmaker-like isoform X2 [Dysidea avara]|uniref:protein starmaker-like isoform X2 n=1 Tax=Dysidea avara TaxID=196820 RepID=UPI003317A2E8